MTKFARSIRNVPPGEGFTRIEQQRQDGLPDGVHTGGCWLSPDRVEVWKPLDGGNAHDGPHYSTLEAECLEEMAGKPGFPPNWLVREQNGRRWLVRDKALVYGQDFPPTAARAELGEEVEQMVRALNARGWELGDAISLAFDKQTYQWFILDLSCAAQTYSTNPMWDDEWRLWEWWEKNGWTSLLHIRKAARHLISSLQVRYDNDIPDGWKWVYASRHRPFSLTWGHKLRGIVKLVPNQYDTKTRVHTWIIAEGPLSDDVIYNYELVLCWWPWDTPARRQKG